MRKYSKQQKKSVEVRLLFTFTCAVSLLLSGCTETGSEKNDPVSTSSEPPDESTPVSDPVSTPDPTPTPDPAPEASPEEADPEPSASQCIVGTWLADNDFFLAGIREFGDEVKSVSGEVFLTFKADGSLSTEYQEWEISAVTQGLGVTISRTGTDIGTYSVQADTVTIEESTMGSTMTMGGSGMSMNIDPTPAIYHDAAIECESQSALIETPDGSLRLTRN